MNDLAHVYTSLLAADSGYGRGDHWRPVWDLIARRVPPGGSILDVGCGRGGMVTHAQALGFAAVGCDIAPCHTWITKAQLPCLPFETAEWDLVGCFDVLEHLPESDVPAACAELRRVARRHLIVSVAECSDPRTVDGVEVELHLTRRPVDWWCGQFDNRATVIPSPGQPDWRTYLDITI